MYCAWVCLTAAVSIWGGATCRWGSNCTMQHKRPVYNCWRRVIICNLIHVYRTVGTGRTKIKHSSKTVKDNLWNILWLPKSLLSYLLELMNDLRLTFVRLSLVLLGEFKILKKRSLPVYRAINMVNRNAKLSVWTNPRRSYFTFYTVTFQ